MADTATVSTETLKTLQGKNMVLMARPKSLAGTMEAVLIPFQTTFSFDPSVDSDSTSTKDGAQNSRSSVSTDAEVEMLNSNAWIADRLRHALFNGEEIELWAVQKDRLRINADNKTSEAYMWYMQGSVKEDSNDNDSDDFSKRDVTFAIDSTPKDGWGKFSETQQQDFDYLFRGIGIVTEDDPNGGGTAFNADTDSAGRPVAVETIAINPTSTSIKVGATTQLKTTLTPENANAAITFTSSDKAIATVSNDGIVTGVKAGSADITATASGKSGKATVTVTAI